MKKLLTLSAAGLMAFTVLQAQTDPPLTKEEKKEIKKEKKENRITLKRMEGTDVAYGSKQEFYRIYGNTTDVKWTRAQYMDEAVFNKDGVATTSYFDADGHLVGTTSVKTFADLPADAQRRIKKDYKDYSVERVVFFDDNEDVDTDMILYGQQFDDKDNYFAELKKDNKRVVVQVSTNGQVGFFSE